MAETVRVAVLYGFGINCDHETKAVFELVGAEADRVHVNRFVSGDADLKSYDILAVPGGFSFGDHLGSGRLMGCSHWERATLPGENHHGSPQGQWMKRM